MPEAKVLDYNRNEVRSKLLRALRAATKDYTNADLARATGLPLAQIGAEMPAISDEYRGRLKVSEQGDLLYSFPQGFRSRYKGFGPSLKRILAAAKKSAATVGKSLFKVWILVTLFGYFFLFIALALVALFGSVAMQGNGNSRSRSDRRGGGGLGGLWLTTSLFDSLIRLWFYSELFKSADARARNGFGYARRERHPLHKAVFSHVFGDGDPNADWNSVLKRAFVAFAQSHQGVITLPEFMAISGLRPEEAQERITKFCVEFEGTPEVSDSGAIYFFFPALLAKNVNVSANVASSFPLKQLKRFSSNEPKLDRTFRWINIVNLLFGSYFLYNAISIGTNVVVRTAQGTALKGGLTFLYSYTVYFASQIGFHNPASVLGWALGVAPLAFSAFFFGIPALRSLRLSRENEALKRENMRKVLYSAVIANPKGFDHRAVNLASEDVRPASVQAMQQELQHLAAWGEGEIAADGTWAFKDLEFTEREATRVRAGVRESDYAPTSTVFDSDAKA